MAGTHLYRGADRPIDDDPNVTDKKFPGNLTLSYRSGATLRIMAEVVQWQGHATEQVRQMKDHLDRMKAEGIDVIID